MKSRADVAILDAAGTLEAFSDKASVYIGRTDIARRSQEVREALAAIMSDEAAMRILLISGIAGLNEMLVLKPEELTALICGGNKKLQLVFTDSVSKVGHTYGGVTAVVKENMYQILFGGDLQNQRFIDNLPTEKRREVVPRHVLHSLKDERLEEIAMPREEGR